MGSANFSPSSQIVNDENMLITRSDLRAADVYFSEFMRLLEHLYARYRARIIKARKNKSAKAKGDDLRPDPGWMADHFGDTQKSRRRQYFHGA